MSKETSEPRTIDITPTWSGLLPVLLMGMDDPDSVTREGRMIAKQELANMAKAADKWNAHCKKGDDILRQPFKGGGKDE